MPLNVLRCYKAQSIVRQMCQWLVFIRNTNIQMEQPGNKRSDLTRLVIDGRQLPRAVGGRFGDTLMRLKQKNPSVRR